MNGTFDIILQIASQIPVVVVFSYVILKIKEGNAAERISVQKNFREYVEMHTRTNAEVQGKVAEAITLLAKELHTTGERNSAEHGEILDWVRKQRR